MRYSVYVKRNSKPGLCKLMSDVLRASWCVFRNHGPRENPYSLKLSVQEAILYKSFEQELGVLLSFGVGSVILCV